MWLKPTFINSEIKLFTTIEAEQGGVVEVLILGRHEVALCFQPVVLGLVELGYVGFAVFIFCSGKVESGLIAA